MARITTRTLHKEPLQKRCTRGATALHIHPRALRRGKFVTPQNPIQTLHFGFVHTCCAVFKQFNHPFGVHPNRTENRGLNKALDRLIDHSARTILTAQHRPEIPADVAPGEYIHHPHLYRALMLRTLAPMQEEHLHIVPHVVHRHHPHEAQAHPCVGHTR